MIAGDFDSLSASVEKFYGKKFEDFRVEFRRDDDQNSTDFDKAIDVVKEYESSRKVSQRYIQLNVDDFFCNCCIGRVGWTC